MKIEEFALLKRGAELLTQTAEFIRTSGTLAPDHPLHTAIREHAAQVDALEPPAAPLIEPSGHLITGPGTPAPEPDKQ